MAKRRMTDNTLARTSPTTPRKSTACRVSLSVHYLSRPCTPQPASSAPNAMTSPAAAHTSPATASRTGASRILDAAQHLMVNHGRGAFRLTDFALAMRMAPQTIRRHFVDLDCVLAQILHRHLMAIVRALAEIPRDAPNRARAHRSAYLALTRTPFGNPTEAHLLLIGTATSSRPTCASRSRPTAPPSAKSSLAPTPPPPWPCSTRPNSTPRRSRQRSPPSHKPPSRPSPIARRNTKRHPSFSALETMTAPSIGWNGAIPPKTPQHS